MKYTIIGAGGTGGCIGSYLAKSGKDVTLIARGSHLKAIQSNELTVHSVRAGNFNVKVKACTMEEYSDTPDVIFVCVKYYSLQESIDFINRTANDHTLVIPILNIFGTGSEIQESCPACTALDGCIYIVSMIEAPGVIAQTTDIFKIFFGYRKDQEKKLQDKALAVCEDLKNAGIDAFYTDDIMKEAIKKFSFVSPMGAAGLYLNAVGGDFKKPGEPLDTFYSLIDEVQALGKAMGISYEEDLKDVNYRIMSGMPDDSTTSLMRDVYLGKPSELDGLIHRIVRLGQKYNLSLPTYEKISEWARLIDCIPYGIEEINVKNAFLHFNNDSEMYAEILDTYYDSYEENLKALKKALEEKDYHTYIIKAHSLKSTSATIGAQALSEHAKKHEFAGKDGNYEFISKDAESLFAEYSDLINKLSVTKKNYIAKTSSSAGSLPELSDADYIKGLSDIAALIEDFEADQACELLSSLMEHSLDETKQSVLSKISDYIEDYQYDEVLEFITATLETAI